MSNQAIQKEEPGEIDLVAIWLKFDAKRWIAGAFAGMFAAAVMIGFSMALCSFSGGELWFPVKIASIPFLGHLALDEVSHNQSLTIGIIMYEALGAFLGAVYAHFTGTNRMGPLLGMGLTWGCFGWVFINNLFSHSWRNIIAARVHEGAAFGAWIVFGIALTSVAFFDRALRAGR